MGELAFFRLQKTLNFDEVVINKQDVDCAIRMNKKFGFIGDKKSYTFDTKELFKGAAPFVIQNLLHTGLTLYLNNKQTELTNQSLELARKQLDLSQKSHDKQFDMTQQAKSAAVGAFVGVAVAKISSVGGPWFAQGLSNLCTIL